MIYLHMESNSEKIKPNNSEIQNKKTSIIKSKKTNLNKKSKSFIPEINNKRRKTQKNFGRKNNLEQKSFEKDTEQFKINIINADKRKTIKQKKFFKTSINKSSLSFIINEKEKKLKNFDQDKITKINKNFLNTVNENWESSNNKLKKSSFFRSKSLIEEDCVIENNVSDLNKAFFIEANFTQNEKKEEKDKNFLNPTYGLSKDYNKKTSITEIIKKKDSIKKKILNNNSSFFLNLNNDEKIDLSNNEKNLEEKEIVLKKEFNKKSTLNINFKDKIRNNNSSFFRINDNQGTNENIKSKLKKNSSSFFGNNDNQGTKDNIKSKLKKNSSIYYTIEKKKTEKKIALYKNMKNYIIFGDKNNFLEVDLSQNIAILNNINGNLKNMKNYKKSNDNKFVNKNIFIECELILENNLKKIYNLRLIKIENYISYVELDGEKIFRNESKNFNHLLSVIKNKNLKRIEYTNKKNHLKLVIIPKKFLVYFKYPVETVKKKSKSKKNRKKIIFEELIGKIKFKNKKHDKGYIALVNNLYKKEVKNKKNFYLSHFIQFDCFLSFNYAKAEITIGSKTFCLSKVQNKD